MMAADVPPTVHPPSLLCRPNMSRLRGPVTYGRQTGGTVHVETDNPGLLALLRQQSSAESTKPRTGNSDPSPRVSQRSSGPVDRRERVRESGGFSSHVGRTAEGSSGFAASTEGGVKDNSTPADQFSVPAETAWSTYVEGVLETGATSGPAVSADARGEEKAGHGLRKEDWEESGRTAGLGVSEASPDTERGQCGLERETGEGHKDRGLAVSLALPDSDSVAGSSPPPTPSSSASAARPSVPDLNSPEHPRFLTPYSSRRLKGRPTDGKPVIAVFDEQGVRTRLSVPENLRQSREQAGRLKAGGQGNWDTGSQAPLLQKTPHPDSSPAVAGDQSGFSGRGLEEEGGKASTHTVHQDDTKNLPSDRNSTWKEHRQPSPQSVSLHRDHSGQSLSGAPAERGHSGGHSTNSASGSDRVNADRGPQASSVTVSEQLLPSPSQRGLGVSQRLYVDWPTFTQGEEEVYRFVSSRADDDEEPSEPHLTHSGLDQHALNKMAATAPIQPIRKPFKQVRYQDDEERFEDREDILPYTYSTQDFRQPPAEAHTQYVLRSKTGSAKTADDPPPPPSQPARGLNLPSGPSYDPQDEEDLERETTYQQELRNRVDTLQREAEATVLPHLDLQTHTQENLPPGEEMEQESLAYPHHHRDSLTMYEGQRLPPSMQNAQWGDPPPQPIYPNPHGYAPATHRNYADQEGRGYAELEGQGYAAAATHRSYADRERPGYADLEGRGYAELEGQGYAHMQGQGYADLEGRGYAAETERRGYGRTQAGHGDPYNGDRFEERDYPQMPQAHPAGDGSYPPPPQGHYGNTHQEPSPVRGYVQNGYAELRDGFYLTEPRGYAQEEDNDGAALHAPNQAIDEDRYQIQDGTQRPSPRQHSGTITLPNRPDYDYVSHNKADYGFSPKRTYIKIKEVKRREEERLSHFFVDPKVKGKGKKGSRDSSPARPLALTYPAGATGGPHGTTGGPQGPEEVWAQRSAYLAQANNAKVSPTHSPPYSYPGDIIQPTVTQHVVTEDGQRISVDVNLRLVSPPVGSEGDAYVAGQPQHFLRQTGMQYPLPVVRTAREEVHSDSHDYADPVYTTTVSPPNPFRKIPPIGAASDEAPNSAPAAESEGSYMLSYLREREKRVLSQEKPWYRVYGIKDFKRMQKEVQLGRGTLGPDLENDTFREKRDKMLRKLDYARAVKDRNMKELTARKPASFPRDREQDDMLSKRKLAVEYAKHVPKPTVKPKASPANSYEMASKLSPLAKPGDKKPRANQDKASVEVLDLDKLQQRHQADKRSAEMIQQKAQGVAS